MVSQENDMVSAVLRRDAQLSVIVKSRMNPQQLVEATDVIDLIGF
jgi:hypothetical protein